MKAAKYTQTVEAVLLPVVRRKKTDPVEDWILKAIGRGKKVLDLGCGDGRFTSEISKRNNDVFGLELNSYGLKKCREKKLQVRRADLNEGLPFEDKVFDVVVASDVLDQIYDTSFLFAECARVLKSGGQLLVTAYNLNSLHNRWRVLMGKSAENWGAFPEDRGGQRIRALNAQVLSELCSRSGFDVAELLGYSSSDNSTLWRRSLDHLGRMYPALSQRLLLKARLR
jgi:methionine biosynthesis protein MetW